MVQTTKNAMKKMPNTELELHLTRYLLHQHTTPHSTTGRSPSELLMGRRVRTLLDSVAPSMEQHMKRKEADHVSRQLIPTRVFEEVPTRVFEEEQKVFCRNFATQGPRWTPTIVKQTLGPVSYNKSAVHNLSMLHFA